MNLRRFAFSVTSVTSPSAADTITFPIDHASLALLGLLSNLSDRRCLTIVGTEGMVRRHYLVNPHVEVDALRDYHQRIDEIASVEADTFLDEMRRASIMQTFPPPTAVVIESWLRVRSFAIAFEYDAKRKFTADALRSRMQACFKDPGHFHGILVPETCMAWNENASVDASKLGHAAVNTKAPLAQFRHRVLGALASFPRTSASMSIDLRPYFGDSAEI